MSKPITIFFKRNSRAAINAQLAEMNELIEKGYRFKVTNDRKSCVVLFPIPRFILEIPGEESEEEVVTSDEVVASDEATSEDSQETDGAVAQPVEQLVEQSSEENPEEAQPVEDSSTPDPLDVDSLLAELEELSGMKEIVDAFVKKVGVEIPADKIHPNAKKKWLKEYLTSLKG